MSDTPDTPNPGPVELYILAAGLLLGILLGPAVLGRVAPTAHASLFGGGPATQQLIDYDEETAAMVAALEATGVTAKFEEKYLELSGPRGMEFPPYELDFVSASRWTLTVKVPDVEPAPKRRRGANQQSNNN